MMMNNRYELILSEEHDQESSILYAKDLITRRKVIIKAKPYQGQGASIEKEILQALVHEHLPDLLDIFVEDETEYLVLAYFEGKTLKDCIDQNLLTEKKVIDYFVQLSGVVAYLHEHDLGVVHRDITPRNIMVNERGHLKLIDFDASTCEAYSFKEEDMDATYGTIGYAAPENILYPEMSGYQSDVYGIGATLSACLKSISSLYSLELELIAKKGSAIQPNRRYKDIQQMKTDFELLV
jgi:serine/threonine-protein kinase